MEKTFPLRLSQLCEEEYLVFSTKISLTIDGYLCKIIGVKRTYSNKRRFSVFLSEDSILKECIMKILYTVIVL